MAILVGEGQVLSYVVVTNGFLNGRKLCCYLLGSNTAVAYVERKKMPIVFIITHHLLLKVEVAFKRVQTAKNLSFWPPHPRTMFAFNDIFIYKS